MVESSATDQHAAPRAPLLHLLIGAALFAVAHTQAPLYYSNQHQYFLHGLAWAGEGDLAHDWLANTADPTPLFSAIVFATAKPSLHFLFHAYYFALLVAYAVSLARIVEACGFSLNGGRGAAFFTLLIAVHAGIVRLLSVRIAGVDYPWYLQSGVAGQYLLGPGLQPSAFGVLLLASLAAYLHDRPVWAGALAGLAALMHFTYFLLAGMLVVGCLVPADVRRQPRQALRLAAAAAAVMLPGLVYSLWTFWPEREELARLAQQILVEFRIPHHALARKWFNGIAAAQLVWIALGIAAVARQRLAIVLASVGGLSAALTVVQLASSSYFLALLFPWRATAFLMPIATSLILAVIVHAAAHYFAGAPSVRLACGVLCGLVLVFTVSGGVWIMSTRSAYHAGDDEAALLEHVRTRRQPGDVYLLPIRTPKLIDAPRRSISTSFTPAPRSHKDRHLIAVDLQRFRLATGAAIFVDFKAIPYKEVEVLEWRSRLSLVERWYAANDWDHPDIRAALRGYGITHIVVAMPYEPRGSAWTLQFADDAYRVYRLED